MTSISSLRFLEEGIVRQWKKPKTPQIVKLRRQIAFMDTLKKLSHRTIRIQWFCISLQKFLTKCLILNFCIYRKQNPQKKQKCLKFKKPNFEYFKLNIFSKVPKKNFINCPITFPIKIDSMSVMISSTESILVTFKLFIGNLMIDKTPRVKNVVFFLSNGINIAHPLI